MEPLTAVPFNPLIDDVWVYTCRFLPYKQLKPLSLSCRRMQNIVARYLYVRAFKPLCALYPFIPDFNPSIRQLECSSNLKVFQVTHAIKTLKSEILTYMDTLDGAKIESIKQSVHALDPIATNVIEAAADLKAEDSEFGEGLINRRKALCLCTRSLFDHIEHLHLSSFVLMGSHENLRTRVQEYVSAGLISKAVDIIVDTNKTYDFSLMTPILEGYVEACRFQAAREILPQFQRRQGFFELMVSLVTKLIDQRSYSWVPLFFQLISPEQKELLMDNVYIHLGDRVHGHEIEDVAGFLEGELRRKFEVKLTLKAALNRWIQKDAITKPETVLIGFCTTHTLELIEALKEWVDKDMKAALYEFFKRVPVSNDQQAVLYQVLQYSVEHNWEIADKLVQFEMDKSHKTEHLTLIAKRSTKPKPLGVM